MDLADVIETPEDLCEHAGLVYVDVSRPGWTRQRCGKGFTYRNARGRTINGSDRVRLQALAIPPAWTDVWIAPRRDAHILAVGRDDADRLQYLYHPEFREAAERTKYRRLGPFGAALEDLRRQVVDDLTSDDPERRMVAAVVRLLDRGLLRVGTVAPEDPDDAVGATTLRNEHVAVDVGSGAIEIDFLAKGGKQRNVCIEDRPLAAAIADGMALCASCVFSYETDDGIRDVSADQVNTYLRHQTGQAFTAKDFRTWGGTVVVARELASTGAPASDDDHHRDLLDAVEVAAEELGNTRDVARQSYLSPVVVDAHRDGSLHDTWSRTRAGKWADRSERTTMRLHED